MSWQFSVVQLPPFVSAALALIVINIAWDHREKPTTKAFLVSMGALVEWSVVYGVQLGFTDLSRQLFLDRVAFVGAAIVPTAWLIFVALYAGRDEWLTRQTLGLLAVEPLVTVALVWTNHLHGLVYPGVAMARDAVTPILDLTFGVWYWINLGYSYLLVLASLILLLRLLTNGPRIYRKQAATLVCATLIPLVVNVLFAVGLTPLQNIDLTTFTFALTGVFVAGGMFKFDLLDRVPIARQRVTELIGDGFVVTDGDYRIIEYNATAARIVDCEMQTGQHVLDVFPQDDVETLDGAELTAHIDREAQFYQTLCAPLSGQSDGRVGYIIVMRDVTDRKLYEQRLEVTNRLLRHNLRNKSNVILGRADNLTEQLSGEAAEEARAIKHSAERLGNLSQKAQRIETIPTPQVETLETTTIDVSTVVRDVVERFRTAYPDATIETDIEPAHVETVGREFFTEAIENVVENALEHTDRDPKVRVTVETGSPVHISVADNGLGIPEIETAVLEDGQETALQHGSGLGLWLVNWIVSASGGEVSFESNEPRGSVVTIELPAA